jgi:hypothetical protein
MGGRIPDAVSHQITECQKGRFIMAEEKKNAQVLNGINEDITELKSLSTLRKRVVSDGEIVSRSEIGFRLAKGNAGVLLRSDGLNFSALVTPDG